MKRRWLLTVFALVAADLSVFVARSSAQESAPADGKHAEVILTNLSPPVYPPISRVAHITGDVTVVLGIRKDGTIKSAAATSGPPLLLKAALESVQQSQFECRNCSEALTPYSLTYTFRLTDPDCDTTGGLHITQSGNHVTAIDKAAQTCDPAATRVRAAKCLYLWKCGWG